MEKIISPSLNKTKVVVSVDTLKPNDVIYISKKEDACPYLVLDVGVPFILIENMKTHFANMYRPTIIYKEVDSSGL